jgi:hypothetical protein
VRIEPDKLGGQCRQLVVSCGAPKLQDEVPALHIVELAETLDERFHGARAVAEHQQADPPYLASLLRFGCERRGEEDEHKADQSC